MLLQIKSYGGGGDDDENRIPSSRKFISSIDSIIQIYGNISLQS